MSKMRAIYSRENFHTETHHLFGIRSRDDVSDPLYRKSVHVIGSVCQVQFKPKCAPTSYDGLWSESWTGLLRASVATRTITYDNPDTDECARILQRATEGKTSQLDSTHVTEKEKFSIALKAQPGMDSHRRCGCCELM